MRKLPVKKVVFLAIALPAILTGLALAADQQEMSAQAPSTQLRKEHEITLKLLDAAQEETAKIRQSGQTNKTRILKMHDFFSNFVDKCHHAKEERFYFPAAKFYDGNAIDGLAIGLINEHNYGRTLLQEIAFMLRENQPADPMLIADRLDRYAEMIRVHINKENEILYTQADLLLPRTEKAGMIEGFARIEQLELGEGFHEKYHALAMEILQ